ncbi:MAG: hypothetical protein HYV18_05840 [Gammaproteobacteria bacterium]|nr:hypothetical protein [Gammaproteobacteria bacterium]
MKTQAVVVADDPVYLNWLQNALGAAAEVSLLRPADAEELLTRIEAAGRVDLAFFQFDSANIAARASWIERLTERFPDLPVVGVGQDRSPDVVLAAMRSGARDFFLLGRDDGSVAGQLGKLLRRGGSATRAGQRQGQLHALVGCHPDGGIAFAAEHLALACVDKMGRATERVLLVDLATPPGAAAIFLNISQSYSVLDAINDVYRCDQTLIDTAFSRHGSGLFVLSLPEDLVGRPQFSPDDLLKLLQIFRTLFAVTIVTLDGQAPLPALAGVVTQADRSLLLSDQSILKSRHSKFLLRALRLEDCPLDRTGLVVDNFRRRLGLEPESLAQLLDLPLVGTLAGGQAGNRMHSMNTGEPIFTVAPKDPYCADVRRLADYLLTGQAVIGEAQGWLARLFA